MSRLSSAGDSAATTTGSCLRHPRALICFHREVERSASIAMSVRGSACGEGASVRRVDPAERDALDQVEDGRADRAVEDHDREIWKDFGLKPH
jgi:hypothetical protein